MEHSQYEEEPYSTKSSMALTGSRRTHPTATLPSPPADFYYPQHRYHFIPTILSFDDW